MCKTCDADAAAASDYSNQYDENHKIITFDKTKQRKGRLAKQHFLTVCEQRILRTYRMYQASDASNTTLT